MKKQQHRAPVHPCQLIDLNHIYIFLLLAQKSFSAFLVSKTIIKIKTVIAVVQQIDSIQDRYIIRNYSIWVCGFNWTGSSINP